MLCFSMSQYMLAFVVPSMNCSSPVPAALMQPQTMTLPPPFLTVGKTHLSLYSSPGCHHTRLIPSEPNKFILVSSDHRTWFQLSMSLVFLVHHLEVLISRLVSFCIAYLVSVCACLVFCCEKIRKVCSSASRQQCKEILFERSSLYQRKLKAARKCIYLSLFFFFFFFFFFCLSVAQITHDSTYAWLYYHHSQPFFFLFFLFFFFSF